MKRTLRITWPQTIRRSQERTEPVMDWTYNEERQRRTLRYSIGASGGWPVGGGRRRPGRPKPSGGELLRKLVGCHPTHVQLGGSHGRL